MGGTDSVRTPPYEKGVLLFNTALALPGYYTILPAIMQGLYKKAFPGFLPGNALCNFYLTKILLISY